MADVPPLPEGARLALLHWPWGTPTWREISAAAGPAKDGRARQYRGCVLPLIRLGLLDELVEYNEQGESVSRRFRLTPAGRRALDEIQSGEAGR